jgi:hypothetical protein
MSPSQSYPPPTWPRSQTTSQLTCGRQQLVQNPWFEYDRTTAQDILLHGVSSDTRRFDNRRTLPEEDDPKDDTGSPDMSWFDVTIRSARTFNGSHKSLYITHIANTWVVEMNRKYVFRDRGGIQLARSTIDILCRSFLMLAVPTSPPRPQHSSAVVT